eukprot:TRINITY_DN16273_c0_g1_i2.p1 TRINITY_DN16273_c0_g1~~TRINITY_DN16273_c0_g1_i2.p1  ORF type:complete len:281 (+),score=28.81 TRINITY_DN16273_c0_g1_i2:84-926(+)
MLAQGYRSAQSVLLCTTDELAAAINVSVAEAATIQAEVAAAVAPAPQSLLGVGSGCVQLGVPTIDNALGGGIPVGLLTEVAGPPGCGKSQLCLTASALACGTDKVLYVDTEGKFSAERLAEIAVANGRPPCSVGNVDVMTVSTVRDLADLPSELELLLHGGGARLIVIDSVAALLQSDPMSAADRSDFLAQLASRLKELASRFRAAVLITNHTGSARQEAALGNTWHHCVNIRLVLSASTEITSSCPRAMCIAKSPLSPNTRILYRIGAQGTAEIAEPQP